MKGDLEVIEEVVCVCVSVCVCVCVCVCDWMDASFNLVPAWNISLNVVLIVIIRL